MRRTFSNPAVHVKFTTMKMVVVVVALRSSAGAGSATARSRQRVKSAGGWPRAVPVPRCQTAGAGDAASRCIVSENLRKIQRPKTVRRLAIVVMLYSQARITVRRRCR